MVLLMPSFPSSSVYKLPSWAFVARCRTGVLFASQVEMWHILNVLDYVGLAAWAQEIGGFILIMTYFS